MSVSRNKVNDFLISAKTMIENALSDKDVKTALAGYGYDEANLAGFLANVDHIKVLSSYFNQASIQNSQAQ